MQRLQWLALVGCLLFVPTLAQAQASIAGVVRDTSGAVLPGVTVEASSPALIEKARIVTTDDTGRFNIVDLRPGAYSLTFTLTGFRVVKREGVELSGTFAATINAEMSLGSVEETVTVTGESPTVDVQNTRRSNVISTEVVEALPAARSQYAMVALLPGTVGPNNDVGGTKSMQIQAFSIHGSRTGDQRLMVNGLTSRNLLASAWASNYVPDMGMAAEIALDYSSGGADSIGGGLSNQRHPEGGWQPLLRVLLHRVRQQFVPDHLGQLRVPLDLTSRAAGEPAVRLREQLHILLGIAGTQRQRVSGAELFDGVAVGG